MAFTISKNNIFLGTDFELTFGEVRLTLDKGYMQLGGEFPL